MLRTYRTSKGTELPLMNLRGREYLEVKYRLVWFREEHRDWAIETEFLSVDENSAYARATIKDEHGRVIATSHKFESRKGFPDFIEKAETGAIGRALALIGYGTQFCADELDEGERVVDAPVASRAENRAPARKTAPPVPPRASEVIPKSLVSTNVTASSAAAPVVAAKASTPTASAPASKEAGEYMIGFGKKYKGLKLKEIPRSELEGYIEWLEESAAKKGLPLSEEARILKTAVGKFLAAPRAPTARIAASEGASGVTGAQH